MYGNDRGGEIRSGDTTAPEDRYVGRCLIDIAITMRSKMLWKWAWWCMYHNKDVEVSAVGCTEIEARHKGQEEEGER